MEPIYVGILSILPPVLAVALALITKEVFSSLIVGILSGTLIYTLHTDGNVIAGTVETAITVMTNKFDLNIVLFCSLLGSLVYVIYLSGGSQAYGRWASKSINSKRKALYSTAALGGAVFIDDYFNCLTVGTVMRPITDTYRVSRAKLAYIIDSTAAPICIIAPISSWAAAVGSNLKDTKAFDSEIVAFISTIPWNFYALLSLFLVVLVCAFRLDFGPMKVYEKKALTDKIPQDEVSVSDNGYSKEHRFNEDGRVFDMVLPIVSLIIFTVIFMLYFGGYWGDDTAFHSVGAAFGNTDSSKSLVLGSFGGLFVAFVLFVPRGLITLKLFMEGVMRGVQAMIPANMILTFAWTISGITRDLLQAPEFISSIVQNDIGFVGLVLPAVIFVIAGFLAFSTGTAWGTFGILIPIVVTVAQAIDRTGATDIVIISLSATLAGSVFGDHCSPISDTTVLSSAGAKCDHIEHVYTQLPYALIAALSSFIGYVVAGFTSSLLLSFGAAVATVITAAVIINIKNKFSTQKKSEPSAC